MKQLVIISIIIFSIGFKLCAQEDNTPAAQLAHKIANKMRDSLNLTNQQTAKIFTINMDLHRKKSQVMHQSQSRDITARQLQTIENTRDSSYSRVLSTDQFSLYLKKKRFIVNNNSH
jgi:hypothetical protein